MKSEAVNEERKIQHFINSFGRGTTGVSPNVTFTEEEKEEEKKKKKVKKSVHQGLYLRI
jgi:hypothetical protein